MLQSYQNSEYDTFNEITLLRKTWFSGVKIDFHLFTQEHIDILVIAFVHLKAKLFRGMHLFVNRGLTVSFYFQSSIKTKHFTQDGIPDSTIIQCDSVLILNLNTCFSIDTKDYIDYQQLFLE